jgi:hypothetical protein
MATEMTTETLAPDKDSGPFRITLQWQVLEGRWEAIGVRIAFADQDRARPLHTSDLRRLRLSQIVERAASELQRQLDEDSAALKEAPPEQLSRSEYRARLLAVREAEEAAELARARGRGRPRVPLHDLKEVARIYSEAFFDRRPPTKAVAEELKLTYSAATKRITQCRALGLLGEAERGKAGGATFVGRGDAASMRSQIAIDEEMARRHLEKERREKELVEKIRPAEVDQMSHEG